MGWVWVVINYSCLPGLCGHDLPLGGIYKLVRLGGRRKSLGYYPELRAGSSGGIPYLQIHLDETIVKRPFLVAS